MKAIRVAVYIIGVLALFMLGYGFGQRRAQNSPVTLVKTDTVEVIKIDTITAYKPVEITRRVVDTMVVYLTDTCYREVLVQVPREERVYVEKDYRAVISGFEPSLDSLEIYRKTFYQEVTRTVTKPAPVWSFGVTAGWGVQYGTFSRTVDTGPAIVVGLQYRF